MFGGLTRLWKVNRPNPILEAERTERLCEMVGDLRVDETDLRAMKRPSNETLFAHEFGRIVWTKYFRIYINGKVHGQRGLASKLSRLARMGLAQSHHYMLLEHMRATTDEYAEVFADIVAILDAHSPHVIANAHGLRSWAQLGFEDEFVTERALELEPLRFVDFTANLDGAAWEQYLAKTSTSVARVFAPARGAIWRRYLAHLEAHRRVWFLECFMDAASRHMIRRAREFVLSDGYESTSRLNKDFLETLDGRVRELDLLH